MTSVVVTGLLMLVGLVGIVVPFLPGLLLVWLATALWAFEHPNRWAWAVFALCGVVYAVGVVTQYLVPGRRLKDAGVKTSTLFLAVLLAIVLFFSFPWLGHRSASCSVFSWSRRAGIGSPGRPGARPSTRSRRSRCRSASSWSPGSSSC